MKRVLPYMRYEFETMVWERKVSVIQAEQCLKELQEKIELEFLQFQTSTGTTLTQAPSSSAAAAAASAAATMSSSAARARTSTTSTSSSSRNNATSAGPSGITVSVLAGLSSLALMVEGEDCVAISTATPETSAASDTLSTTTAVERLQAVFNRLKQDAENLLNNDYARLNRNDRCWLRCAVTDSIPDWEEQVNDLIGNNHLTAEEVEEQVEELQEDFAEMSQALFETKLRVSRASSSPLPDDLTVEQLVELHDELAVRNNRM
jgi:hypothetical protein